MRAVSTVLDAALCLLLVSASALTLAGTPTGPSTAADPDTADEAAELLATSTARVTYEADGADTEAAMGAESGSTARNRTVHDTLAGLLASAATADATGSRAPPAARSTADAISFVRAVTARVDRALRRLDGGVQVIAQRNASALSGTPHGRVVAGDAPPPEADVHAARFAVRGVRLTVRTWSA
ncbi:MULTISPECIES: hypothetical protein [Halorussus]|uniref:DUF7284 family protein n=1 Tax=Halorussus TaxID=1070314 RepID=UPI0013B378FF|nr:MULTISPECIES: hypothetical protein [Halorussus]NHN58059.1 hypothetical protein [Halorussus sp. JP-T4]